MEEIKKAKKTINKLNKAIKIIKEAMPKYEDYKNRMGIDDLEFEIYELNREIRYYKDEIKNDK
jgi:hypothetical protein